MSIAPIIHFSPLVASPVVARYGDKRFQIRATGAGDLCYSYGVDEQDAIERAIQSTPLWAALRPQMTATA